MWKGIIGGFGEYFQIDATLLRILFILFVIVTGIFPGVIAYLIAIFIIPLPPGAPTPPPADNPTS
jgi:phage shock protein C